MDYLFRLIPSINLQGLIKAGFLIKEEAQHLVPVDIGNLKASGFVVWKNPGGLDLNVPKNRKLPFKKPRKKKGPGSSVADYQKIHKLAKAKAKKELPLSIRKEFFAVTVGFSAYYAAYVHENKEMNHPNGGEARFLSKAVNRNKMAILKTVAQEARKINR